MKGIAFLAVFGLIAISATTGLRCFVCTYVEGISENDDCVTLPPDTDLQICPGTRAVFDESTQVSKISNALLNAIEGRGQGTSRGIGDIYCAKISAEVDGDKVVVRSCVAATVEEDLNGKCETPPDTCQEGVCLRNVKACYCNRDACHPNDNGPVVTTTPRPPNSGTSLLSLPILVISCLGSMF